MEMNMKGGDEIPEEMWKFLIDFVKEKHKDQLDDEGKDYFEAHILQVVNILKQITNDETTIAMGYLHDTIEDTETTYEELKEKFGKEIADGVMELTHEGNKEKGFYFPRLKSKKAILVKFADRISNLSRMGGWSESRQAHYIKHSKFWRGEMKRKNKKIINIMFISDDYNEMLVDENDEDSFKNTTIRKIEKEDNSSNFKFKVDLFDSFEKVTKAVLNKKYDIALIDYGLIGDNEKLAISILRTLHLKGIKLAWVGALAGHYKDSIKRDFPKLKFLHNLDCSDIKYYSILSLLRYIFEGEKK